MSFSRAPTKRIVNERPSSLVATCPTEVRDIIALGAKMAKMHLAKKDGADMWRSDVSHAKAIELLMSTQGVSPSFRGFSVAEMEVVASQMTFIKAEKGQILLQKDEVASFFLVLVQGGIDIHLPGLTLSRLHTHLSSVPRLHLYGEHASRKIPAPEQRIVLPFPIVLTQTLP